MRRFRSAKSDFVAGFPAINEPAITPPIETIANGNSTTCGSATTAERPPIRDAVLSTNRVLFADSLLRCLRQASICLESCQHLTVPPSGRKIKGELMTRVLLLGYDPESVDF